MTKKQIIIDGIDVSGCKHFKIGTCLADYLLTDMNFSEAKCELCTNCYYKQLKRKEQECEELKEDRERWKSNFNGKVSAIKELLQQLDQLKAKDIKNSKTLTEIKEIAEKQVKRAPDGETFARSEIKQILQKISECEV